MLKDDEGGYVLISTIWLILLGATLVTAISLTVLNNAEFHAEERERVRKILAIESAYETVVADILFNGPRSNFALLPASADYNLSGFPMKVEVIAENGKIDLNNAEPALVERALRGLAVPSIARNAYLEAYRMRRSKAQTLLSIADIEAEMQNAGIKIAAPSNDNGSLCASQFFTSHSGLSQPDSVHSPPKLNRALNVANVANSVPVRLGSSLRIKIKAEKGLPLIAIVRITGNLDKPVTILDWHYGLDCADDR